MRKLITVLAALVSGMALVAETRADVNFEARLTQVFRVSGSFDVDVEIRSTGTETFVLGTSTFLFNYNIAGLTTPAKVSANDGPWDLNVVTEGDYLNVALNSGTGWAGLRVEFAGGDPDPGPPPIDNNGQIVPTSFTRVGTVRFTILDAGQNSDLAWKNITTNTQVFRLTNPGDPTQPPPQTDITLLGTFVDPDNTPLPIQMASSAASVVRNNDVEVAWKTVSETNNYGFEVFRRRGESGEWTKLGFIEGHGTTLAPQSYTYTDRSLSFGKYFYRIKQVDLDGKSEVFPEMAVTVGVGPDKFILAQNYPNPFNPSTLIEFAVPVSGHTTMKVYNVLGQEVATLFEGNAEAGRVNAARFDASNLPSGLYFYTLRSAGKVETKRMLLMK